VNDDLTKLERPPFPEEKAKFRYVNGFKDIIANHIVNSQVQKQVIILVSHSDGINPFLSIHDANKTIKSPCYCCTICYEVVNKGDDNFKINSCSLLAK
jgi:hypothetical protein